MKTVAVVPINRLSSAKSRLADHLSESDRRELVGWMARHVLSSLHKSGRLEGVALVSPDSEALSWAVDHGAVPLYQRGQGLNSGLELGRNWAIRSGADALLVLLGDLPCLSPEEVSEFIECGRSHPVVLAPDQHRQGTNGLLMQLSVNLPFAFGPASLKRHLALARAKRTLPMLFQAPGLGFDVDSFAELSMLYEFGIWMPGDHELPRASAHGGLGGERC